MPRLLHRASRGLPAVFWWLFAGQGVMALATFVFPFLALFLGSRGFSSVRTGLVVALFGAGSVPAGLIAGGLSDRLGRRPALIGALLSAAVLTAILPALSSPALLAAAVLLLGVALHAYYPAMGAAVADVLPEDRLSEAYGLLYWERNAGIAVSFALGGVLAAHGYDRLFLADAASTLVFAGLAWWGIPETRPARAVTAVRGVERGFGAALADRDLLVLLALLLASMMAMLQFMVALPLVMTARGLGTQAYGQAMAANGLVIVLLQPAAGRLSARRSQGKVLALGALLIAAGNGAYALCRAPWTWAAATGVWSVGEILTIPTASAIVARLSPADLRGRYQGLLGLAFGLALTLAPAIGGVVLGQLGATAVWAGAAATGALAAAGYLAEERRWAKPARATDEGERT